MTPSNIFALVLVFYIFANSESSMVKLNNGGYEDIVIAINPYVKEDPQIIENIKNMVKEATSLLFDATGQRVYIRSVKILIPVSWSAKDYTRPTAERYDTADIIIADPTLMYADDPYTQQYGRCGEPGQYIHLTPNFMTDDTLSSVYGPRGKVFVHEWAHLRWGVFDENSLDNPFYIGWNLKVQATRCSVDIYGETKIQKCQGTSCWVTSCGFDPFTGLYEKGCVFVPDRDQFAKESLMYMQALPDVTKFCDESTHNAEAPNMQNRMCNSRSTWEVIASSNDIRSTQPNPGLTIPEPTFTVLQFSERVVTLVLDTSESMGSMDRINRMNQAAEVFISHSVETGSYVGIVTYSSSASIKSPLLQIKSDADRLQLKRLLPKVASGGRNICAGLLAAIQVNGARPGSEIILLSAGEDDYDTRLCFPQIIESGVIVHVIFLGSAEEPSLKEIVEITGGIVFLATDNTNLNAQGLIDAFSAISASDGDITKQSIQLESASSSLQPAQCMNGTVFIDNTVGKDTIFVVTWQTAIPNIKLQDPNGNIYTPAQFISNPTSKSSNLIIPGTVESGPWHYSLCNYHSSAEVLGLVVNSKASDENVSPIVVKAHMNQDVNQYPNPMVIYASVSQGLMPVTGAKVTAIIEPVTGPIVTLELLDNGAGPDIMKDDGIYSKYFTKFLANGRYSLKVWVENNKKGKSRLVLPKNRALYVPGFIVNGSIIMRTPRSKMADEDLSIGEFSRTASGGSFLVSNVPTGPQPDIYRPDKINDLEATIVDDMIVLSWTATGDDLDQGKATTYDLRMNLNPSDLRTNFDGSTSVDISSLAPLPAGSRETFSFVPENVVIKNGTILYFALVATDKVAQRSDVSNIAQAALVIPRTSDPPTGDSSDGLNITTVPRPPTGDSSDGLNITTVPRPPTGDSSDGLSITTITLIVCGAAILICIIACITVCIVSCKRKKSNPQVRV